MQKKKIKRYQNKRHIKEIDEVRGKGKGKGREGEETNSTYIDP